MISNILVTTRYTRRYPENTRNSRKYLKIKKIPGNTWSYNLTLLPKFDPILGILSRTRPDPTRYWKTLPAGHWWEPARRFSLLIFLHISVLTMFMMENLGREWCAWCLGRPQGFGCSGGARRRSWCFRSTQRQASSRTLWVLDWFSSLLVTNYGLLVIRQCKRIVIFSIHMMIETHLTAHSGIYMTAGKSYCSLLSTFILSLLKKRIP